MGISSVRPGTDESVLDCRGICKRGYHVHTYIHTYIHTCIHKYVHTYRHTVKK